MLNRDRKTKGIVFHNKLIATDGVKLRLNRNAIVQLNYYNDAKLVWHYIFPRSRIIITLAHMYRLFVHMHFSAIITYFTVHR